MRNAVASARKTPRPTNRTRASACPAAAAKSTWSGTAATVTTIELSAKRAMGPPVKMAR
jgi:hypothetical protein